ncbi:unnamed protein product, partial [Heterosigma akashiwo]
MVAPTSVLLVAILWSLLLLFRAEGFVTDLNHGRAFFQATASEVKMSLESFNDKPPRVLIVDAIDQSAASCLTEAGCVVHFASKITDTDLASQLISESQGGPFSAVVVRSANTVTKSLLEMAAEEGGKGALQVVGRAGVGLDNIDTTAAAALGVTVVNAPNGNSGAVAEHTMALLLSLARRVGEGKASLAEGRWAKAELTGTGLEGKSLGVVGVGAVGKRVIKLARAFGMLPLALEMPLAFYREGA